MTPAVNAARRANIVHRLLEYECRSGRGYGEQAAAELGLSPALVYKTLVAKLDDDQLVVALVPVTSELDLKALAALAGARRAQMALPREAERATGYLLGAISPLGQRRLLPTYADNAIIIPELIYVSGGKRGLELEIAPHDLLASCKARLGHIAR